MRYSTSVDTIKLVVTTEEEPSALMLSDTASGDTICIYGDQMGLIKIIRRALGDIQQPTEGD